jgi:hypothetical protein
MTEAEWHMRLIVAACAALMLAGAAHADEVAVFTGKSRLVFFPFPKLRIECEYRYKGKLFLMTYFDQSSCPKVYKFPSEKKNPGVK